MNKYATLILSALVLPFLSLKMVFADSTGFYIGPQLAKPFFVTSSSARGSKSSLLGLTAGYEFKNDSPYRAHFAFHSGTCGDDVYVYSDLNCYGMPDNAIFEYMLMTLGMDYVIEKDQPMSWFVGAHIGKGSVNMHIYNPVIAGYEYVSGPQHLKKSIDGLAFGVQAGAIFNLYESIVLEAGITHTWTTIRANRLKTVLRKFNHNLDGPDTIEIKYDPSMEQLLYPYLNVIYVF